MTAHPVSGQVASFPSHPWTVSFRNTCHASPDIFKFHLVWHVFRHLFLVQGWSALCKREASAQPAAPIQPVTVPERRFSHVHVDIGGPLPTSAEVSPHQVHIRSQKCMDTFISTWVARYGVLALISSNQGHQFTSAMWTGLHKMPGVQLINNTAYHPQSKWHVGKMPWPVEGCFAGLTC
jgi:hypothetical protein